MFDWIGIFNAALNILSGMSLWLEGMEYAGSPVKRIVNALNRGVVCRLSAVNQEAPSLGWGSSHYYQITIGVVD